jgi:hypothetical protein
MAQLSVKEYDQLERAIRDARKIALTRRGTEYILVPLNIRIRSGKEVIEARNPTTGDEMIIFIDDVESFHVVG